ncbi:MAG: L,D-transpeptidase family protein [Geobacteraceae bacterium]|jgi:L,D-peptidoglycan transpeptidase YkuD (ErfK/YbiS/YcfS/YnhG family)
MESGNLTSLLRYLLSLAIIVVTGCTTTKAFNVTECIDQNSGGFGSEVCLQCRIPPQIREMLPSLSLKAKESGQVVLVSNTNMTSFSAKIYLLEKSIKGWQLVSAPIDAVIGKSGFALPGEKREGDGKAPSGIYLLKRTFGYGQSVETRMSYQQVTAEDIWVDDVKSEDYNKLVKKTQTVPASYEKMKRGDNLYHYGIVVEYNTNPVIKGYGSAVFFHVWGGPSVPTVGCIAMSEDHILRLLGWLDPSKNPIAVMGTEEMLKSLLKE